MTKARPPHSPHILPNRIFLRKFFFFKKSKGATKASTTQFLPKKTSTVTTKIYANRTEPKDLQYMKEKLVDPEEIQQQYSLEEDTIIAQKDVPERLQLKYQK